MIECPTCEGGGVEIDEFGHQTGETCSRCDGTGEIEGAGYYQEIRDEAMIEEARIARQFD